MTKRLQIRRDTAENWAKVNPVLLMGEIGFIVNNGYISSLKIGNGVSPYSMLDEYMLIKADDIEGLIKAEDVAKIYLPRAEALSKIQIEALLADKIGFDEFELGKDDLIEQLQRVTLALYDDNLMALVPNDAIIMEQLAPDVREAIASGGGSSDIKLTPNRMVETDSNGNLIANDQFSVATLIDAFEAWVLGNRRALDAKVHNANILEYNIVDIANPYGPRGDLIKVEEIPEDKEGTGAVAYIANDGVSPSGYSNYSRQFAYRVENKKTSTYPLTSHTYYLLATDINSELYEQYKYDSDQDKFYYNESDGNVYTWGDDADGNRTLVECPELISGYKIQPRTIDETRLNDRVSEKLNMGSMMPFMGLLTETQVYNVSLRPYAYKQDEGDYSEMGIFFYQKDGGRGWFVAMSQNDAINSGAGENGLGAYYYFPNSELFNDYSSGVPVAREDQLFIIQLRENEAGVEATGEDRGVYRYNGITKSFIKLF